MKIQIGIALFAGCMQVASAGELGRDTADAVSTFIFSGVKSALSGASHIAEEDRLCIAELANNALSDVYLPMLGQRFKATKLAGYDAFFSSPLGQRYLKAFLREPSQAGFSPGAFEDGEIQVIRNTMNDAEFMAFASDANPAQPGPARDKALELIQSCGSGN